MGTAENRLLLNSFEGLVTKLIVQKRAPCGITVFYPHGAYVERTVAIPDGIHPSMITTGIVLNRDETFRHLPTTIVKIDGKYFEKISSLTNSTYTVIWNPVIFVDVANHWEKDAVNDMGSRMVVTGVSKSTYEPDRRITRAEFAAIVVRALGLAQGTKESSFGDARSAHFLQSMRMVMRFRTTQRRALQPALRAGL